MFVHGTHQMHLIYTACNRLRLSTDIKSLLTYLLTYLLTLNYPDTYTGCGMRCEAGDCMRQRLLFVDNREGFIRTRVASRQLMHTFESKRDFCHFTFYIYKNIAYKL